MSKFGESFPVKELSLHSKLVSYKKSGKTLNRKGWSHRETGEFQNIEKAALQHFLEQGYKGWHDEGYWINQTMRSAMLCGMNTKAEFLEFASGFTDPRNSHAQGILASAKDYGDNLNYISLTSAELISKIRFSSKKDVFDFIKDDAAKKRFHASPNMNDLDLVLYQEFLDHIDMDFIADIAKQQVSSKTFAGFPDLTLWKSTGITFLEIKGPSDRLTANQRETFTNVFLPLKLNFEIVSVSEVI